MSTLSLGTTNQTPNLGRATLEDRRTLDDAELDAVTGGCISTKHPAKVTVPDLKMT
jgi:hypothetical protein